jgi:hypothetical protein
VRHTTIASTSSEVPPKLTVLVAYATTSSSP